MSELTIKIEAPELSAAIQQLAEALKPRKTAEQGGQNPKPIAPAAAPAMPVPAPPTQVSAPAVPVSAPAAATPAVRPATPIPAAMTAPVAQTVAPAACFTPRAYACCPVCARCTHVSAAVYIRYVVQRDRPADEPGQGRAAAAAADKIRRPKAA